MEKHHASYRSLPEDASPLRRRGQPVVITLDSFHLIMTKDCALRLFDIVELRDRAHGGELISRGMQLLGRLRHELDQPDRATAGAVARRREKVRPISQAM
jgi:hypothetical protein